MLLSHTEEFTPIYDPKLHIGYTELSVHLEQTCGNRWQEHSYDTTREERQRTFNNPQHMKRGHHINLHYHM